MGTFYEFEIQRNRYLRNTLMGYYSIDFVSATQSGKLTFLHTLKNNKLDKKEADLNSAKYEAMDLILDFLHTYL